MRDERRFWVNPKMGPRIAVVGWAAQFIPGAGHATNFHLTAVELSFTYDAETLVI